MASSSRVSPSSVSPRRVRHGVEYTRQLDLFAPATFGVPITVIGAGALGSLVTWLLAKMGCRDLTVYDADTVELHNLPNQVYGLGDVGRRKVDALKEIVFQGTEIRLTAQPRPFVRGALRGIVFVCVDSMEERKRIWESSIRGRPAVKLLIEARLGAEGGRLYTVRPTVRQEIRRYEETLYTDAEALANPCTRQTIMPTVAVVAGHAVFALLRHVWRLKGVSEVLVSLDPLILTHDTF